MAIFKVSDLIKPTGNGDERAINTQVTGSYTVKSTEEKPTSGVSDGDDLLEVDTGKVFVFYDGEWVEI